MECQNPGRAPPAANTRLKPLPHEPTDFYDRNASVDIPLDSASVSVWKLVNVSNTYFHQFVFSKLISFLIIGFKKQREGVASQGD